MFCWTLVCALLVLVLLANAAPVLARVAFGKRLAWPIDGGRSLADGRPLLGAAKTYRGVGAALVLTAAAAELMGLDWRLGLIIAASAMAGDLLSSFIKRRLGKPAHTPSPLLDEIPEALLPTLAVAVPLALTLLEAVAVVLGFVTLHGALERLAVRLRQGPPSA